MYLKHFGFNEFPFSLTANLQFFCSLKAYREALNVVMVSLHNDEGFVKITGEVGTGKTLLCQKLLATLGDKYVTVYLANSGLTPSDLQKAIAYKLGGALPEASNIDTHRLSQILIDKLIELKHRDKKVVVIVDEAHALSDQTLEELRLLSNLEHESNKLIQIILVGQPELDKKLKKSHLRQLKQRITFSYRLPALHTQAELLSYMCFRLAAAGYNDAYHSLFSPQAIKLLLRASRGIPRLVNILCHKAFLITYGYNKSLVDVDSIRRAISDTESVNPVVLTLAYPYPLSLTWLSLSLLTVTVVLGSYSIFKLGSLIL